MASKIEDIQPVWFYRSAPLLFQRKLYFAFNLGRKINCVYLLLCKNSSRICGSDEVEFVGVALIVLAESQHTKREQKGRRPGFWGQKLMEPFVGCAPRLKKLFTSASQYSANSQTHIEQLSPAPICEIKHSFFISSFVRFSLRTFRTKLILAAQHLQDLLDQLKKILAPQLPHPLKCNHPHQRV